MNQQHIVIDFGRFVSSAALAFDVEGPHLVEGMHRLQDLPARYATSSAGPRHPHAAPSSLCTSTPPSMLCPAVTSPTAICSTAFPAVLRAEGELQAQLAAGSQDDLVPVPRPELAAAVAQQASAGAAGLISACCAGALRHLHAVTR